MTATLDLDFGRYRMLKHITNKFKSDISKLLTKPTKIDAASHIFSEKKISASALKVVRKLQSSGYESYLVGGCIRDLLMGMKPKDFDVATSATPEQVKSLFSRSRIIGRRFRIVHVRIGPEIIEVTTFRAQHADGQNGLTNSKLSSNGILLRDNVFGSIAEDAIRRDFTMNALYYCPKENKIIDYTKGLIDINKRVIRIIGNPSKRYREDPVRMLRAIRFTAKLGFSLENKSCQAIERSRLLLADIPPARLFDEFLKLFMNGFALSSYNGLREHGLFEILFPATERALALKSNCYSKFIEQALVNTDKRIRKKQRVTPAFLLAAFLWPALKNIEKISFGQKKINQFLLQENVDKVIHDQCKRVAIPRRFSLSIKEIWEMQLRLPRRAGNQAFKLMDNKRFRAGYDFLLLREDAGEIESGLGSWWTVFQGAKDEAQKEMVIDVESSQKRSSKKIRNNS